MTSRAFVRTLQLDLPYDRGLDVLALQSRLSVLGAPVGTPDGIYGPQTAAAVRAWQTQQGIPATGTCDEATWKRLFPDATDAGADRLSQLTARLREDHSRFQGSCRWRLERDGIHIDGAPAHGSGGPPETVGRIWAQFGEPITRWSTRLGVPAELIVATIATKSSGNPKAIRFEPHYKSDEETPNQVSPGLMQTLISTAREALGNTGIDRNWLLVPENSIQAGTAYILKQSQQTGFDPPVVACSYNAGSIVLNDCAANPWRMRQYPLDTSEHCDRFVKWFNDCMAVFAGLDRKPPVSFSAMLTGSASLLVASAIPANQLAPAASG